MAFAVRSENILQVREREREREGKEGFSLWNCHTYPQISTVTIYQVVGEM